MATEHAEMRPAAEIEAVADAQRRLDALIAGLDASTARRPSVLPGWTVAHVLTHLARNADSHTRRAEAARAGEVVDQYPGGVEQRTREIEEGAGRDPGAIVRDVVEAGERLERTWEAVPDDRWEAVSRDVSGLERHLRELPSRRWQELEVHIIDLGLGVTHRDWSDAFVERWLPPLLQTLADRLPEGASVPDDIDERDELAWLYGRLRRDDLPELAPWG